MQIRFDWYMSCIPLIRVQNMNRTTIRRLSVGIVFLLAVVLQSSAFAAERGWYELSVKWPAPKGKQNSLFVNTRRDFEQWATPYRNGLAFRVQKFQTTAEIHFAPKFYLHLAPGVFYSDPDCSWSAGSRTLIDNIWDLFMVQNQELSEGGRFYYENILESTAMLSHTDTGSPNLVSALDLSHRSDCGGGGFLVRELEYGDNGELHRFAADFKYMGGGAGRVTGFIRYNASDRFRPSDWKSDDSWLTVGPPPWRTPYRGRIGLDVRTERSPFSQDRSRSTVEADREIDLTPPAAEREVPAPEPPPVSEVLPNVGPPASEPEADPAPKRDPEPVARKAIPSDSPTRDEPAFIEPDLVFEPAPDEWFEPITERVSDPVPESMSPPTREVKSEPAVDPNSTLPSEEVPLSPRGEDSGTVASGVELESRIASLDAPGSPAPSRLDSAASGVASERIQAKGTDPPKPTQLFRVDSGAHAIQGRVRVRDSANPTIVPAESTQSEIARRVKSKGPDAELETAAASSPRRLILAPVREPQPRGPLYRTRVSAESAGASPATDSVFLRWIERLAAAWASVYTAAIHLLIGA